MRQTVMYKISRYNPLPKLYDPDVGLMVVPACPEFKKYYSYTVAVGDTIAGLARKFYGDTQFQWAIMTSNELPFPLVLTPGAVLLIPDRLEVMKYMSGR